MWTNISYKNLSMATAAPPTRSKISTKKTSSEIKMKCIKCGSYFCLLIFSSSKGHRSRHLYNIFIRGQGHFHNMKYLTSSTAPLYLTYTETMRQYFCAWNIFRKFYKVHGALQYWYLTHPGHSLSWSGWDIGALHTILYDYITLMLQHQYGGPLGGGQIPG